MATSSPYTIPLGLVANRGTVPLASRDEPLDAEDQPADANGSASVLSDRPAFETQAAIETLFKAAAQDDSLQLLPWLEREFTIAAMKLTRGNQLKAARILGVTRATLRKRIERFAITRELNIQ